MAKTAAERKAAERERKAAEAAVEAAIGPECVSCGMTFPAGIDHRVLVEHVMECGQHPMHALVVRERQLWAALETINIPAIVDEDGNLWLRVGTQGENQTAINLGQPGEIVTAALTTWSNQREAALKA